jgi:hypothetical protein
MSVPVGNQTPFVRPLFKLLLLLLKMLGLVLYVASSFISLIGLLVLYACVVWHSVTSIDFSKLESIQRNLHNFVAQGFLMTFVAEDVLVRLTFITLPLWTRNLDAFFPY